MNHRSLRQSSRHFKSRKLTVRDIEEALEPCKGVDPRLDGEINSDNCRRMAYTLSQIPAARGPEDRLLDIGGTIFWALAYHRILGYRRISVVSRPGGAFWEAYGNSAIFGDLEIDLIECDAELDPYPGEPGFDVICCNALLEHLAGDPMHMMEQVNLLLKDQGYFCLTTPNVMSRYALVKPLIGRHPYSWSVFTNSFADRHNREYSPGEMREIFLQSGLHPIWLSTFDWIKSDPWWQRLLCHLAAYPMALFSTLTRMVPYGMRRAEILICGRKTGPLRERYPGFLYELFGNTRVDFHGKFALAMEALEQVHPGAGYPLSKTLISLKDLPEAIPCQGSIPLTVDYRLNREWDLLVDLFQGERWCGQYREKLMEGRGSHAFSFIPQESTPPGETYYFTLKLVPPGEDWEKNVLDLRSENFSVLEK